MRLAATAVALAAGLALPQPARAQLTVAACKVVAGTVFRPDGSGVLRPSSVDPGALTIDLVRLPSGDLDAVTAGAGSTASLRHDAAHVEIAFSNGAAFLSGMAASGAFETFMFKMKGPHSGVATWTVVRNLHDVPDRGDDTVETATYTGDCRGLGTTAP